MKREESGMWRRQGGVTKVNSSMLSQVHHGYNNLFSLHLSLSSLHSLTLSLSHPLTLPLSLTLCSFLFINHLAYRLQEGKRSTGELDVIIIAVYLLLQRKTILYHCTFTRTWLLFLSFFTFKASLLIATNKSPCRTSITNETLRIINTI